MFRSFLYEEVAQVVTKLQTVCKTSLEKMCLHCLFEVVGNVLNQLLTTCNRCRVHLSLLVVIKRCGGKHSRKRENRVTFLHKIAPVKSLYL